jgi:hypothetical protein
LNADDIKAIDIVQLVYRVRSDLSNTARDGDMVIIAPISLPRARRHLDELALTVAALADPASLLEDDEVVAAVLARPGLLERALSELTPEARAGALARCGIWMVEPTPDPELVP